MTRDYWNLYTDRKVSQRLETIGPPLQTVCLCYRTSSYYRPKDSIVSDGSSQNLLLKRSLLKQIIMVEVLKFNNFHRRPIRTQSSLLYYNNP